MGREMKFALIVGGSMVLGAIVFAVKTHYERPALPSTPLVPVRTVSQELDSLAQATQAPPPTAPDYSPTWIPASSDEADSSIRQGSTATLSSDEESDDKATGSSAPVNTKSRRATAAPTYTPAEPEPPTTPPADASQTNTNATPSNNEELRNYLRRGK
ncbi:MAG: hypothetical protein ACRENN_00350 [Candidatus Eiseniibacteriota bacterium]